MFTMLIPPCCHAVMATWWHVAEVQARVVQQDRKDEIGMFMSLDGSSATQDGRESATAGQVASGASKTVATVLARSGMMEASRVAGQA